MLRTKLLQHGGAKEPTDLLADLVGDGIVRYQNGGIVPDITSCLEEMKLFDKRKTGLFREEKNKINKHEGE